LPGFGGVPDGDLVHFKGSRSWRIRSGIDQPLSLVLYVRDTAGLGRYVLPEPDLPPLRPAVPMQPQDIDLRPFILTISELPLQGAGGWVLNENHVLPSTQLSENAAALTEFLRPVVEALA
jgi:hypothetical protein